MALKMSELSFNSALMPIKNWSSLIENPNLVPLISQLTSINMLDLSILRQVNFDIYVLYLQVWRFFILYYSKLIFKFNFIIVPHIKIEPSSYLDVDLGPLEEKLTNGYYDDEWIVDASGKNIWIRSFKSSIGAQSFTLLFNQNHSISLHQDINRGFFSLEELSSLLWFHKYKSSLLS